jgi:DNA-directed RNA polymerase subunit K/omega
MNEQVLAKAEKQIPNLYLLINVATRRAEQVMEGAVPGYPAKTAGPIEVALREISDEVITSDEAKAAWTVGPEKDPQKESG